MAKVLIVDDSRLSRAIVGNALRDAGHDVLEAANGNEGLALLAVESFDLVISDLLMPQCDGVSMLQQVRGNGNQVPVIICSADIQDSSRKLCESLGISEFLGKPIRAEKLITQVNKALAPMEVLS